MLKVPCGIGGRVRIVKENSITGEITHDSEFTNIWTDHGISTISTYASRNAPWPNNLVYGSGVHTEPHNEVTRLKTYIGGTAGLKFGGSSGKVIGSQTCTVTRTSSITVPKKGVAWTIRELGLSYGSSASSNLLTYTLVKNLQGVPTPVEVSDIEIVTIYYTLQVHYPMTLPPINVEVSGLPPTTATFFLRPEFYGFASSHIGAAQNGSTSNFMQSYTTYDFGGGSWCENSGNKCVWGVNKINRENRYFGHNSGAAIHIWEMNPPISKNNTQVLELEIFWQFTNVTPIEIP